MENSLSGLEGVKLSSSASAVFFSLCDMDVCAYVNALAAWVTTFTVYGHNTKMRKMQLYEYYGETKDELKMNYNKLSDIIDMATYSIAKEKTIILKI